MIVEVKLDGYGSKRQEVTIQGGRVTRVEFVLEAEPRKTARASSSGTAETETPNARFEFLRAGMKFERQRLRRGVFRCKGGGS